MVRLTNVHLKLMSDAGPVNILKGIDLAIPGGETVSIVGPSGSGKSSLMMIMGGLERPTDGKVEIAGQDLNVLNEDGLARFRRDRIGIVFQNFHLVPTMTALENVAIPLEFAGDPQAFDKAKAELEMVGLGHRLTHYPSQLSGGEQQRVALARALVAEPSLLLADEPTGNLDGDTGHKVIALLFEMAARKNATVMLITHDMALAERCHRIIRLADGLVVSNAIAAERRAALAAE
jgi:putative ABC transport system ATP-binding protein